MQPMTKRDKDWRAEDDARAMLTVAELKGDKPRLAAAKRALEKLQKEAADKQRNAGIAKKLRGLY